MVSENLARSLGCLARRALTKRALVDGDSESFPLEKAAASRSGQVRGRCCKVFAGGVLPLPHQSL